MSVIDTTNVIIGNSPTQSQNMKITGNGDGTFTFSRADGSQTLMTMDASGVVTATQGLVTNRLVLATAQATTSGTSIDFTGIPSWVKRITVMFNGVSTNGVTHLLIQLGAGSITTTGYRSNMAIMVGGASGSTAQNTTGFAVWNGNAAEIIDGLMIINLVSANTFISSHSGGKANAATPYGVSGGGSIALGGTLDRIRLTTVNGTDTFDAGSVNIMYEG